MNAEQGKMTPEDELRSARKEIAFVEYVALPDALSAIARARQEERDQDEGYPGIAIDFLRNEDLLAQALSWIRRQGQGIDGIDDARKLADAIQSALTTPGSRYQFEALTAPRAEGEKE